MLSATQTAATPEQRSEQPIRRWARRRGSSSTSSSSESSSSSSESRRKRRSSFHTEISDLDFTARISILKAREESRQVPRGFTLYLPPSLTALDSEKRVFRTSSLPDILNRLDTALIKRSSRRDHDRLGDAKDTLNKVPSRPPSFTDLSAYRKPKGKHKDTSDGKDSLPPKAWFLDVASPSAADMQAVGKLLHLHPLTLEDILYQDPREKMEYFPKLGYYFVSFRTLVNAAVRQEFEAELALDDEGFLGEANVYLVVFREGICTFHFTDIAHHIDGVLNRVTQLEKSLNMSSDWIAHGILDSIVDSLSSFLHKIDREVTAIEELVFSPGHKGVTSSSLTLTEPSEKTSLWRSEKHASVPDDSRSRLPKPSMTWWKTRREKKATRISASNSSLLRMARTRRLVTSLSRLLATKSEVIAQLRKRLLTGGISKADDTEVAIYMGDVQDHILTMQHSLAHYERMLSQSHPIYLSQLRNTESKTKSGTDKALIYLTTVSIAVLCIQTLIGLFSLNITVPRNGNLPGYPYHVFGIILALSCIVLVTYLAVVRRWWLQAKRRRGAVL